MRLIESIEDVDFKTFPGGDKFSVLVGRHESTGASELLLHENDLAALCIETLITKISSNGWKIISPSVAIEDEIYKTRPMTLFNNNCQVAALYYEAKGMKLHDPWSYPWEDGKLIREEFDRRKVFE